MATEIREFMDGLAAAATPRTSPQLEPATRYEIVVGQIAGRPDLTFTVEATYERDRRGGRTLVFRRDDATTFEVLDKCLRSAVEAEGEANRKRSEQ